MCTLHGIVKVFKVNKFIPILDEELEVREVKKILPKVERLGARIRLIISPDFSGLLSCSHTALRRGGREWCSLYRYLGEGSRRRTSLVPTTEFSSAGLSWPRKIISLGNFNRRFRASSLAPTLLGHTSMPMMFPLFQSPSCFPFHKRGPQNSCHNLALTSFSNLQVSCFPATLNNC